MVDEKSLFQASEEKSQVQDVPDLYIPSQAFKYQFESEVKKFNEDAQVKLLKTGKNVSKSWFVGKNNAEILWFKAISLENERKIEICIQNADGLRQTIDLSFLLKDVSNLFLVEKYLYNAVGLLPDRFKQEAILGLSTIDFSKDLDNQLLSLFIQLLQKSYSDLDYSQIKSIRSITKLLPQIGSNLEIWQKKEVPVLNFNLSPYIENPIKSERDQDVFQELKTRLKRIATTATPDRDFLERLTVFKGEKAEFVDTKDIKGAVDTAESWGDILESRRPSTVMVELTKSLQSNGLQPRAGDEIVLWRIKEDDGDEGQLFVMEGNHRIAVLVALEVRKFPAVIKTVQIKK